MDGDAPARRAPASGARDGDPLGRVFPGRLRGGAGWSGYATDPLVARWGVGRAGMLLGLIWGLWHVVPYLQADPSVAWIFWYGFVETVALRVLIVWLHRSAGRSVWAAALFHATVNLSFFAFPNGGSHMERFLLDTVLAVAEKGESPVPILLLGLDQGALLALSLACVWPETVSGVAAIGGYLPEIPGWVPDDRPLHGMPVLLVHDPEYPEVSPALQQKTEETLIAKGAQVTVRSVARARQLHPPLAYLLNEWMEIVRSR